MNRKTIMKRIMAVILCVAMCVTIVFPNINIAMFHTYVGADTLPVKSLGSGSIGIGSNEHVASKLPRISKQGTYRFTTDNYNSSHPALDTNDWSSSWLWDLEGDRDTDSTEALSGTNYAFPLSFLMKKDGLRIVKPSMTSNSTNISAYNIKDNDTLGEFKLSPDWTCTNNNIDQITDWSYKAVTTNGSKQMKTIMTQGSPFAFFELSSSNIIYLEKLRVTFPSKIIYEGEYNGAKMIVFRTNDITSSVNGYPGLTYQYYAVFLPVGATVEHLGTTDATGNDGIGKLKITFPSNKTYMSMAWVYESQSHSDDNAVSCAKEYRPYAFNFITDTKADYTYNEESSTVETTYQYSFSKKSESTQDGTIMGILPHQYKYMSGYSYMSNQAVTLRGRMKFLKGSSYKTTMTYKGILPYMPSLSEDDTKGIAQLKNYVKEAAKSDLFVNSSNQETYYHGKKLNRAAQIVAAAKSVGDHESADKVLNKLQENLTEWFTYSGTNDKNYFTYLGEGVGALLGYPTSFNAVDQFNDHHFHYGYFIEAAASVGLYDKEWLNKYKDVVKQLVYDIASPYRNQSDCVADCGNAYPYMRSFSPYEGHSWASGYEDERTGNNQESTSEAINAWAGIILFGELTGDTKIRDLGIYLYTTEVAAADNYWFDIDKDIYHIENTKYEPPMASMVWGGKADYATWFGQQYTQGIQICPMQSWSFYLLNGGENYIKEYYNYDKNSSVAKGGSTDEWNDMWAAYYALADPEYAMNTVWTKNAVNDGESQAHTYHYIQSMIDYGTPDLSFKSTSSLGTVFNKNGTYTFAVYNPTSTMQTVKFTNGSGYSATVKASPNAMTLVNSEDVGKSTFMVEYYGKDLNSNNYSLIDTSVKYANAGDSVTISAKDITGYIYDLANSNNTLTGTVKSDGSLVLKVYYNRAVYGVSYNMNGGNKSDTSLYPASYTYGETYSLDTPTKEGYDFYGWYADPSFEKRIESITAKTNRNLTLYAKWIPAGTIILTDDIYLSFDSDVKGTFTINGSTSYKAINVLYRIADSESEAAKLAADKEEQGFVSWGMDSTGNGWQRTENFSGNKGKYIVFYFIRYDDNGGYKTDYAYGKIASGGGNVTPETTQSQVETTTKPVINDDWSVVESSGDTLFYKNADNMSVVSVQKPGFASESGIYITSSMGVGYATLNGTKADDTQVAIQGAAAVIYTSAFKSEITTVGYYTADGVKIGSIDIKNTNVKETTKPVETTTEVPTTTQPLTTTQAPTTTKAPETTQTVTTTENSESKPSKPSGLVYAGNEALPYYFAWAGMQNVTFNFYVDGVCIATGIVGSSYNAQKDVFAKGGTFTIGITAVQNGVESDMLTLQHTFDAVETTSEETTTQEPATKPEIIENENVRVEGYQISNYAKGSRAVGSVEPVIKGKNVSKWGFVYAIAESNGVTYTVDESDIYVGSNNDYVISMESTDKGTLPVQMGDSKTATYFVRTMLFGANTAQEFTAKYKIRTYALLEDGTYLYSQISSYTIYNIAKQLYDNALMNTISGHDYLYNDILKVVRPDYKAVDYNWAGTIVKPEFG